MRSVKRLFHDGVLDWYHDTGFAVNVNKDNFSLLIKGVWDNLKPEWAISGFAATGLYPLKKDACSRKIVPNARDDLPSNSILSRVQKQGPRSSGRLLIKTLQKEIRPVTPAHIVAHNQKLQQVKRKRVQFKHGEVMTKPLSLARLKEEQEAREAKKRTGPVAGPSGVSITMSTPAPSTGKKTGPTLDSFVIRQSATETPADNTADNTLPFAQDDSTPSTSSLQPSGPSSSGLSGQPRAARLSRKRSSVEETVYREIDTTEDSDDPDVPQSPVASELVDSVVDWKTIRPQSTHIIYNREGSVFPGMVTSKSGRSKTLTVKVMQKQPMASTHWSWPEEDTHHTVSLCDVVGKIRPPKLMSSSRNIYYVKAMAKYW